MKKRLRKKYHLKEFTQYIFGVGFQFDAADDQQSEALFDEFIDFIESQKLGFGGGGMGNQWDGFIEADRKSVTEEQRTSVIEWLVKNDRITAYTVTPLMDGWNGPLMDLDPESVEYTKKSK